MREQVRTLPSTPYLPAQYEDNLLTKTYMVVIRPRKLGHRHGYQNINNILIFFGNSPPHAITLRMAVNHMGEHG